MTPTLRPLLLALAAAALLPACGGGGGGSDATSASSATSTVNTSAPDTTPSSSYAVAAALKQAFQSGLTATLRGPTSAMSSPDSTLQYTIGMAGTGSFEGTTRDIVRYTSKTTSPGVQDQTFVVDHYWDLTTMTRHGLTGPSGGYGVFTDTQAFPASAEPGQNGRLGVLQSWNSSNKTQLYGSSDYVWSLDRIDDANAWFCTQHGATRTDGSWQTNATCYRLTQGAAGTVAKVTGMKSYIAYGAAGRETQIYTQQ